MFGTLHQIGWRSHGLALSGVLLCSFIWAIVLCLDIPVMLAGGRALGIHPGGATLSAALWRCLWGRGQRGNNDTCWLCSSPTFRHFPHFPHVDCGLSHMLIHTWGVCVRSRTLRASPTDSPVILRASLTATTPADLYIQGFWVFSFPC